MSEIIKYANGFGIRFYVEVNGKKERVKLYEKGWTVEDAEAAMVEYRQKTGFVEDKSLTVAGYLQKFYNDYVESNVAESTARRYDDFIALHLVPQIGGVKLQKLRPAEIQAAYTALQKKGLSSTTVLHIHRLLHLALKYAIRWGYLKFNPCDGVKAPSQAKTEMVILDDKQIAFVLQELRSRRGGGLYWPVYIALTTGMRLGEICGLQETSVDLANQKFIVQHTLKRINGRLVLKAPKTAGSRRPVPFLPGTTEELKRYLKERAAYRLRLGIPKTDTAYFLQTKKGGPMQPDDVTRYFKTFIRDMGKAEKLPAGLCEKLTFHSLRHSHASWLLRQGVHPKVVSERLGHSSVTITLNLYSHLLPDMQADVIAGLDLAAFK